MSPARLFVDDIRERLTAAGIDFEDVRRVVHYQDAVDELAAAAGELGDPK